MVSCGSSPSNDESDDDLTGLLEEPDYSLIDVEEVQAKMEQLKQDYEEAVRDGWRPSGGSRKGKGADGAAEEPPEEVLPFWTPLKQKPLV